MLLRELSMQYGSIKDRYTYRKLFVVIDTFQMPFFESVEEDMNQ